MSRGKRKGGGSLDGYCFAITGTLSIRRADFEQLIEAHGGTLAKSVNANCTHLISARTDTNKCRDAEENNITVVDEQWVRDIIEDGDGDGPRTKLKKENCLDCLLPASLYMKELLNETALNSSTISCLKDVPLNEAVGTKVWFRNLYYEKSLEEQLKDVYEVTKRESRKVTVNGKEIERFYYTVKSVTRDEEAKVIEDNNDEEYVLFPSDDRMALWDRHQNNQITEGIWESGLDPCCQCLCASLNESIDVLAQQELVDFHPGTNNIVRDLVHPSLYPLIREEKSSDEYDNNADVDTDHQYHDTSHEGRQNHEVQQSLQQPASFSTILSTLYDWFVTPWMQNQNVPYVIEKNFFQRPFEYPLSRYQWLPAELVVDTRGCAHFITDINNLDATKYSVLYHQLEKLFVCMLPGFEKVWQYARTVTFANDEIEEELSYEPASYESLVGTNLQVIVKIADYQLPPGGSFEGVWHYEGMAHEDIVMTGLYYPDSHTSNKASGVLQGGELEFKRCMTDVECSEASFSGLDRTYSDAWTLEMVNIGLVPLGMTHTLSHLPIQPALGTASSTNSSSGGRGPGAAAPATAGQTPSAGGQPPHPVTSPLGKFVVFPNCHAHRLRKLINTSTTECVTRRIVAFFIINPRKRIESTREHPSSPRTMSLAEAQAARLNLMKERKFAKQDLNPRHIELCEH